jgi:hypothetical protein
VNAEHGLTLVDLYSIPEPRSAVAERAIETLEAEHAEHGCRCLVELVEVKQLGPTKGAVVTLVHELWCPRWIALTS